MIKSNLNGGDGFTFLHVKKLILMHKGINFLLFDVKVRKTTRRGVELCFQKLLS